jgi:ubiquinone/menaquinone biosynthesis C-methylase UbiE
MATLTKDWNRHVNDAEEIARGTGFRHLRDRIIELAAPQPTDVVVDVGAGTGLLSLQLAGRVEQVWAIDICASMVDYLRAKAASANLQNVDAAVASAVSLPLVDAFADVVVSNYCFHHMGDAGKRRALDEAMRVLRPGGRLVFGDMMFDLDPADPRNRAVIAGKVRAMLRKGPAGMLRLAKNAVRLGCGRWEQPARAEWWQTALTEAGFVDVDVTVLEHEGGIASARRPLRY